jgi:hypothetical protein
MLSDTSPQPPVSTSHSRRKKRYLKHFCLEFDTPDVAIESFKSSDGCQWDVTRDVSYEGDGIHYCCTASVSDIPVNLVTTLKKTFPNITDPILKPRHCKFHSHKKVDHLQVNTSTPLKRGSPTEEVVPAISKHKMPAGYGAPQQKSTRMEIQPDLSVVIEESLSDPTRMFAAFLAHQYSEMSRALRAFAVSVPQHGVEAIESTHSLPMKGGESLKRAVISGAEKEIRNELAVIVRKQEVKREGNPSTRRSHQDDQASPGCESLRD